MQTIKYPVHTSRPTKVGALVVAARVLGSIFLLLLLGVSLDTPLVNIERRITSIIASSRTPLLDRLMHAASQWGDTSTVLGLTLVAVLIALFLQRRRAAILIVLSLATSWLFYTILKQLVARPRPPVESASIVQEGFSFPSGNATVSAALFGTIAYLLARSLHRPLARLLIIAVTIFIVLVIGVSRLYLGVHYPSDILAGWTAGSLWIVVVAIVEQVWPSRAREKR